MRRFDLLIIGAGPSGMMCAYTAALRGLSVAVCDPNRQQGRKLRITGKGRCNITNNCDIKTFMNNIPGDGRFLYSALNRFSPADTIDFFINNGLPVKTERGNRVFPESDNANDVADLVVKLCLDSGVVFIRDTIVFTEKIEEYFVSKGKDNSYESDALCICTGGLSYPLTGSNGAGYGFARKFGHNIKKCTASLVPLESDDDYCGEMQGFSLKNIGLTLFENNKPIFHEIGEMLFTHFGVSGPLVLSASSHIRNEDEQYRLEIDLKPGLDSEKLDDRILRDFHENTNKDFKNSLGKLLGKSIIPVVVKLSGISPDIPVHSITREQRQNLVWLLKHFPVNITKKRPVAEAIITSGGIMLNEINPRTMESKIVDKLFFAGEILDLDGYTGGFNLQIAWSTGYVAGNSILKDVYG